MGGVQLRNKIAVELPSDCLPNINDLRQIFDDSQAGLRSSHNGTDSAAAAHHAAAMKRSSHTERTLLQQQQSNAAAAAAATAAAAAAAAFFDAKTSHFEDNIFESKSRNLEFERAKQKFDNPHGLQQPLQHHHHHLQQLQHQQQQQHLQRQQRSTSGRYNSAGSNSNNSNSNSANRANLALPLKCTTNVSSASGTASNKEDMNRQMYESHDKEQLAAGYARNSINLDGLKVSDDEVSPYFTSWTDFFRVFVYYYLRFDCNCCFAMEPFLI